MALGIWISQAIAWPMSFVAPLLAWVFLSLPLPRPSLKMTLEFIVTMSAASFAGVLLLPFLEHARWVGIGLFVLALFHTFYFTAKGGSSALGSLMTLGLTLVAAIGSVNSSVMVEVARGLSVCGVCGMALVWLAHALTPDPRLPAGPPRPPPAPTPEPDLETARLRALRSLLIVLPVALFFLFSSASTSYTIAMIKVATLGQQASVDGTRAAGRSMVASTILGGIGAIIAWQVLSIWPSLPVYAMLMALFALWVGPKIFKDAGLQPRGPMWSYAYLTMIVVLAPAVTDGIGSDSAASAFYSRLFLFLVVTVYGSTLVAVFDAFWPRVTGREAAMKHEPSPA